MASTLTTPKGETIEDPTEDTLANALRELMNDPDEHADLWLDHDNGWTISVVKSGDVFLEDTSDEKERYFTIGPLEEGDIVTLLAAMAQGDMNKVNSYAWEEED